MKQRVINNSTQPKLFLFDEIFFKKFTDFILTYVKFQWSFLFVQDFLEVFDSPIEPGYFLKKHGDLATLRLT